MSADSLEHYAKTRSPEQVQQLAGEQGRADRNGRVWAAPPMCSPTPPNKLVIDSQVADGPSAPPGYLTYNDSRPLLAAGLTFLADVAKPVVTLAFCLGSGGKLEAVCESFHESVYDPEAVGSAAYDWTQIGAELTAYNAAGAGQVEWHAYDQ